MKKRYILFTLLFLLWNNIDAQIDFKHKLEFGYLYFIENTDTNAGVAPASKTTSENESFSIQQSGFDFNFSNGVRINETWYAGIGIGYQNFNHIHGISGYLDTNWIIIKDKIISPYINPKLGYTHLFIENSNHYGSLFFEFNFGLRYYLNKNLSLYLQTGYAKQHKAVFMPIRLGVLF